MVLRCAILLLVLSAGWVPAQTEVTASENAEAVERPTDAEIEKEIRRRFAASLISTNEFQVSVLNGVATLRGRTDIVQHKGTATRLARLAGAVQVENRIEITDRARARASRSARPQPRRVRVRRPRSDQRDER